jgi:hypothetical protein
MQDDDVPPLEDIVQNGDMQQEGSPDGFDATEKAVGDETIQSLKAQVDAMQVEANVPMVGGTWDVAIIWNPSYSSQRRKGIMLIWR